MKNRFKNKTCRRIIARTQWNVAAGTADNNQVKSFRKAVKDLRFWLVKK